MRSICSVCCEEVGRSENRVTCMDCNAIAHNQCLKDVEFYNVLIQEKASNTQTGNRPSRVIQIKCTACRQKGPRKPIPCVLRKTYINSFLVPVLLVDQEPEKLDSDSIEVSGNNSEKNNNCVLAKREEPYVSESVPMSKEVLETTLSKQKITHYLSSFSLNLLRKHRFKIVFSKEQLLYTMPSSLVGRYHSYECSCGVPCDFECADCHYSNINHEECLQKVGESNGYILECLECSKKKTTKKSKNRQTEPVTPIEKEEVVETEAYGKKIAERKAPEAFLSVFDNISNSLSSKKLNKDALADIQKPESKEPEISCEKMVDEIRVSSNSSKPTRISNEESNHQESHRESSESHIKLNEFQQDQSNSVQKAPLGFTEETMDATRAAYQSENSKSITLNGAVHTDMSLLFNESSKMIDETTSIQYTKVVDEFAVPSPPEKPVISEQELQKEAIKEYTQKFISKDVKEILKSEQGPVCYPEFIEGKRLIIFDTGLDDINKKSKVTIKAKKKQVAETTEKVYPEYDVHLFPTSINQIRDNIYWGLYTDYNDFLRAFDHLFHNRLSQYTKRPSEKIYFGNLYSCYMSQLLSEKVHSRFYSDQVKDIRNIVTFWTDWKIPCTNYPRIPRCCRQYNEIKEYVPAVLDSSVSDKISDKRIQDKMACKLGQTCEPTCECNKPIYEQGSLE